MYQYHQQVTVLLLFQGLVTSGLRTPKYKQILTLRISTNKERFINSLMFHLRTAKLHVLSILTASCRTRRFSIWNGDGAFAEFRIKSERYQFSLIRLPISSYLGFHMFNKPRIVFLFGLSEKIQTPMFAVSLRFLKIYNLLSDWIPCPD